MEIEAVKKEVSRIIKDELIKIPNGYRAFFFGSRVTRTASPRSDLDVGIEVPSPVPAEILRAIKLRCENIRTLYSIDIVDFAGTSDDFKKVAKTKIEEI